MGHHNRAGKATNPPRRQYQRWMAILDRYIMNIEDYSFHDSQILGVTENTTDHSFEFLLDFATDWSNNIFERRILKFTEVIFYNIEEIPFVGLPTILNIVNFGQIEKAFGTGRNQISATRTKIEIQTNAGNRIIEFSECELLIPITES